ncbi:MAG TPA: glycine zipper 2TM domain-containing protein [Alphaproteobacteria bacterium]|nr:glycine zipper 2TM domain-containing protein [Alphaproteobacteria bacterium]
MLPVYADETQIFGTALGAGVGGVIGNQFGRGGGNTAATLGGVVAGGYIGNQLTAPRLTSSAPVTGAYYAYTPPPQFMPYAPNYVAPPAPPSPIYADDDSGSFCREYSEKVRIGNQVRESYGTACLQPDGTWRAVEE